MRVYSARSGRLGRGMVVRGWWAFGRQRPGTRDGLRKHVVRSHLLAPLGLVISPIARLGEVHGRSGCRDGPGGGRPAFIHSANEAVLLS